ncbi:hypothetical protein BHU24_20935 [Bacillus pseudomycoides]|jgi:hypothetical protein|uniref:Uncharacterized protein n=1 Tax=Bacillus pseudomycoides TaxID=64104 RepID=A0AAJ3V3I3_9BACI|nr:hypothetical protein bmyco0002_10020 [Bacillus pseudomycoides]EEM12314.1 hypothetical protein bmyco0003_9600 [Bacillus pseudomycoides]MBD5798353.1 hypothetical protein [Bacillus pseudomycoides]MDR4190261.1 hypothetical protein [Bacillus pseudomycoides]MDR4325013.1 hypothetical protein [Bacillus pseudomycoides]
MLGNQNTYKLKNDIQSFFFGGSEQDLFRPMPCKNKKENERGTPFIFITLIYMSENQNEVIYK